MTHSIVLEAQEPEFVPQTLLKTVGVVVCISNPSSGEAEIGGPFGPARQPVYLNQ